MDQRHDNCKVGRKPNALIGNPNQHIGGGLRKWLLEEEKVPIEMLYRLAAQIILGERRLGRQLLRVGHVIEDLAGAGVVGARISRNNALCD